MRLIILTFFLFLFCDATWSQQDEQKIRVHGKVSDEKTGRPLSGATVMVKNAGVIAGEDGEYELFVPRGKSTFRVSYVGYESKRISLDITSPQVLNINMESFITLEEVVITAKPKGNNLAEPVMGVEKLSMEEIKVIPPFMGVVDIMRSVQTLPGVLPTSDASPGFSVRGGSFDQNLILMDQTNIYNPFHFFGVFSAFNPDVISGIELYKGNLPAKYGGRISSLLDVQVKDEIPKKIKGTGSFSYGAGDVRIGVEGPLGGKTSWILGARRSMIDVMMLVNSFGQIKFPIYYFDFNGKISHRFSEKDKLSLSLYCGDDRISFDPVKINYGNDLASLVWSHVYSEKLFSKVNFNVSNYRYNLGFNSNSLNLNYHLKYGITDFTLKADFTQPVNRFFNLGYGVSSTYHVIDPGMIRMEGYEDYKMPLNYALEHGIYLSNKQDLTDFLTLEYGLRWSVFQNMGKAEVYQYDTNYEVTDTAYYSRGEIYNTYNAFEPRVGLVARLNKQVSLKANYTQNAQFIQIAGTTVGTPFEIWFPASNTVKPQYAEQFSFGYFQNYEENAIESSVEVYYKNFRNVIDFADHADLALNRQMEGEIRTGTGRAYGIEFAVKKNTGKLTGFINYTLSRSERTIPGVNDGKTFLSPFDQTHYVNLLGNYRFSKYWSASAIFIFSTGRPISYPSARYRIGTEYFPLYSGRNEYRQSAYHRLDLSATYQLRTNATKRLKDELVFSVYNAYNRKNASMISYGQDETTGMPYAEKVYLGIIPTITYNFKF